MIRIKDTIYPPERADLKRLYDKLKKLPPAEYKIYVVDKKVERSLAQNAYYFSVVVPILAGHCGYSKDEMHEVLKYKFIPQMIFIDNEPIKVPKSTTSLSTKEFTEFLEEIKQWASQEMGVYIPDPGEIPEEVVIESL